MFVQIYQLSSSNCFTLMHRVTHRQRAIAIYITDSACHLREARYPSSRLTSPASFSCRLRLIINSGSLVLTCIRSVALDEIVAPASSCQPVLRREWPTACTRLLSQIGEKPTFGQRPNDLGDVQARRNPRRRTLHPPTPTRASPMQTFGPKSSC
jgi:hypothetical protein